MVGIVWFVFDRVELLREFERNNVSFDISAVCNVQ